MVAFIGQFRRNFCTGWSMVAFIKGGIQFGHDISTSCGHDICTGRSMVAFIGQFGRDICTGWSTVAFIGQSGHKVCTGWSMVAFSLGVGHLWSMVAFIRHFA